MELSIQVYNDQLEAGAVSKLVERYFWAIFSYQYDEKDNTMQQRFIMVIISVFDTQVLNASLFGRPGLVHHACLAGTIFSSLSYDHAHHLHKGRYPPKNRIFWEFFPKGGGGSS